MCVCVYVCVPVLTHVVAVHVDELFQRADDLPVADLQGCGKQ